MIINDMGIMPLVFLPNPTERDYKRGYIERYFIQKVNDTGSPIYEINKNSFSKYGNNPFWLVVSLKWSITGTPDAVVRLNTFAVAEASKVMKNLPLYLRNKTQFNKLQ